MKLPLFQFLDKSLQQLQTKWANILDPVISTVTNLNTKGPQLTFLNSGSGVFKVASGTFYLRVRMVGGGGGGSGSGTSGAGNGTTGNNTTFGTNLLVAQGGGGGTFNGAGGIGNNYNLSNIQAAFGFAGSHGESGMQNPSASAGNMAGGPGGASVFSGNGAGVFGGIGTDAENNTGSGGGGGGVTSVNNAITGSGGAAGSYVEAFITTNIQSSYGYVVGSGGSGGTLGANGFKGGAGANGCIIIEAYFQ